MFEGLKNRFAGRHDWPIVSASVSSAEHREGGRGNPDGYYDIAYSFWVDGHIYGGEYNSRYEMKKDETLDIRYNPKDPDINFNPESDFVYQHGLMPIFLAGAAGLLVMGVFIAINR
jgi:hypothetical protein